MDLSLKFDNVEEAAAAVEAAHPAAYRLGATSQGWRGQIYFDPDNRVVVVIDDCSDDDVDPENVRLRQYSGHDWLGSADLVDEYEFELSKLEECEDDADSARAQELIKEALAVVATCGFADREPRGSSELQREDDKANLINLDLTLRIERLKVQMSLLSSMRAQNILGCLEARNHRHGAKREVAAALGIKPQNVQDNLAAYYRRLNMLG